MDIFSALQTAVSGLQAQSYSLNNISGNIANSQTTGFKRVDTNFVDMIAEQPLLRPDALAAARILEGGETGRRRVLGQGTVRVHLRPDRLVLEIAGGWHVNAPAPASGTGGDLVGIRLDGPVLDRARDDELPSEPMTPGAVQVPPEGRPVILMADGPVTGGYPVVAVVTDAALDLLAQARPGTRIRFRHARPA